MYFLEQYADTESVSRADTGHPHTLQTARIQLTQHRISEKAGHAALGHTCILRYGLVVRISGSHPGGPGSIPGNGIFSSQSSRLDTYIILLLEFM